MKILLTTNYLDGLGGSETFTYTMAMEFVKQGHHVHVFSFTRGLVSNKLQTLMVNSPDNEYDLILVNHNSCLRKINRLRIKEYKIKLGIKGYKIMTCHGIYHKLEQPIAGADKYVAISEEVQEHLKKLGFDSIIIRNGIDLDRFAYTHKKKITTVIGACHGKEARDKVKRASNMLGLEYIGIEDKVWTVEDIYNAGQVVVGLGRTALEAMACGANVIIYDSREYTEWKTCDGLVDLDNVFLIRKHNFSGRYYKKPVTEIELAEMIKQYNFDRGLRMKEYISTEHDISKQVKKYLMLYAGRSS